MKRERERCGVSIRDVMDATKISRRNLTALEEGQLKALPHPVYLKGYVRNIAKMVGLDADELAQMVDSQYDTETGRYLPQTPAAAPVEPAVTAPFATPFGDGAVAASVTETASPAPAPAHQPAPPEPQGEPEPERGNRPRFSTVPLTPAKPKTSGTMRSIIAIVLLLGVLVWLLVRYQETPPEVPPPPAAAVAQPVAVDQNATTPDNASEALDNASTEVTPSAEPGHADVPAATPAKLPPRDPGMAVLNPSATVSASAPASATASVSAKQSVPASAIEVSRAAPVAEMRTPGMQQLVITAKPDEVCWINVSDGQQARSFTLRNGETHRVEFSSRVRVRLGNAGGVSFRLNGQDYPYEGKRGSIETVEFGAR
ncbi:MAG: helix-turn-helix domain-containing protein [Proteobacteria bacterium]|nr:helix-turn-helix domain-containing protein [Pseudomonadota bacterium]